MQPEGTRTPGEPAADAAASEGRTRDTVLRLIAADGPLTAAGIAAALSITPTAVRRHLGSLTEQGLVTGAPVTRRGRGRPARAYVVTASGHAALRSDYDDIAADALRFVASRLGREAVGQFARQRAGQLIGHYRDRVTADRPAQRAGQLAAALSADGYAASAREVPGIAGVPGTGGVQLCQGHCPVHSVAAEYEELCVAEREAFEALLGVDVQRLSTLASGGHVCTTFVPDRPSRDPAGARPASVPREPRTCPAPRNRNEPMTHTRGAPR